MQTAVFLGAIKPVTAFDCLGFRYEKSAVVTGNHVPACYQALRWLAALAQPAAQHPVSQNGYHHQKQQTYQAHCASLVLRRRCCKSSGTLRNSRLYCRMQAFSRPGILQSSQVTNFQLNRAAASFAGRAIPVVHIERCCRGACGGGRGVPFRILCQNLSWPILPV